MHFLFPFFALFFWFFGTQAVLVNVTIDDTTGDSLTGAPVIYTPPDAWNSGPAGCHNCLVDPDVQELSGGTWHDSTFSVDGSSNVHPNVPLTASVSFNGSAVYVFCSLSNSAVAPDGDSDMTFFIDGVVVGTFTRRADGGAGFDYGVPVFAHTVTPGQHTLTLQNGHQNGYQSLTILDSIVYSYDDGHALPDTAPSTTHGPSSAMLAVVAVLVVALLLFLLVLGFFLYRRHRRRRAVYARYMPKGAVRAFPVSLGPTPVSTPAPSIVSPPTAYVGVGASANWWVGRDQKRRDGIATHRPYADLDPTQAGLQRPQPWEHIV